MGRGGGGSGSTALAAAPETFASLLRGFRAAAGLSQQEVAERAGLSPAAIGALERGLRRRPYPRTVRLLSDALGLSVEDRSRLLQAVASAEPEREALGAAARPLRPAPAPAGGAPRTPTLEAHSPLVGRDDELRAGRDLLLVSGCRLLVLTGPPGVGKTRLAVALAEDLQAGFADGSWPVDLAPVADCGLVGLTIGRSFGIRDDRSRPVLEQLAAGIDGRHLLLLLDNFEHLLPAAPLLGELLSACPRLSILVTSRSSLRLRGEHELPVPPLPAEQAVALFVERARARSPRFAVTPRSQPVVAEICTRLDRLPLALELAAPWIKLLSPEALLARLGDRMDMLVAGDQDLPERQQTMRRTLEWSYELLEPEERELFRRLGVFAGGATPDAVEAVWDAVSSRGRALHLLAGLVDRNLLVPASETAEPRVAMLETVREFARSLLAASGELEATARAHAEFHAGLAAAAEPHLEGPERHRWLSRLEGELPNLRAALTWAQEAGEIGFGLQLAAHLLQLWEQADVREGAARLDGLLAVEAEVAPAVRARALHARSVLAFRSGDHARANRDGEASLALYRSLEDRRGTAAVLNYLAGAAWEQGLVDRATELCEQSLAERRLLGNLAEIAGSLANLALLRRERSDEDVVPLLLEALEYHRRAGNNQGALIALASLADIAVLAGRPDEAEAWLDQCDAEAREGPIQSVLGAILLVRAHVARVRGDLAGAARGYREALHSRLQLGHAGRAAYDIEGLAAVAWLSGDPERAARLYGAAAAVRTRVKQRPARSERELHEGIAAQVRAALGEDRFRLGWDAGQRLSLEEAAAEVLDGHQDR